MLNQTVFGMQQTETELSTEPSKLEEKQIPTKRSSNGAYYDFLQNQEIKKSSLIRNPDLSPWSNIAVSIDIKQKVIASEKL